MMMMMGDDVMTCSSLNPTLYAPLIILTTHPPTHPQAPLINIPCVMVSRRLQYYVETQLRPYYSISQHLVSFDATNIFGQYEERNHLQLPQRINAS